ncbi:MAG: AIM24 family protein [Solirubrobacteraceae bacterium]|nr:AIM24 family protein [Solirubrobacteraceae bacterium]
MPTFRLNGTRLLEVDIANETFSALNGSMVAYVGQVAFKKQGMRSGGGGFRGAIKRKVTGESIELMDCSGSGTVYIANAAQEINLIELKGQELFVEASNLVALEGGIQTDQKFTGMQGASSGRGLFTTVAKGNGQVAVTTDGPAIVLEVAPGQPLCVDPQAYVAHSGQLQQDFITDVNWRTAIGQNSGESFQLRFQGNGLVYIQPAERQGGIDL